MALKRKSCTPSRVDAVKRCELSWNMNDVFVNTDNRFLLHDGDNCEENLKTVTTTDSDQTKDVSDSSEEFPVDEKLHELIDSCDFFLRIFGKSSTSCHVADGQWHGLLGQFKLRLVDAPSSVFTFLSCLMEHVKEFWLYVDKTADSHLMYIQLDTLSQLSLSEADNVRIAKKVVRRKNCSKSYEVASVLYFSVETELPGSYFDGLQSKKEFSFKVSFCNLESRTIAVDVYVLEAAVFQPNFPCDAVKPRRCHLALQHLVHHFYGVNGKCKLM